MERRAHGGSPMSPRNDQATLVSSSSKPRPLRDPHATALRPIATGAVHVRLADRVGMHFSPNACVLGFGYFVKKAVTLVDVAAARIEASVRGQKNRRVSLEATTSGFGELRVSCTCSPGSLEPRACRHVWAVLLEIDRVGALTDLRRTRRVLSLAPLATAEPASGAPKDPPQTPSTREPTSKTERSTKKKHPREKEKPARTTRSRRP